MPTVAISTSSFGQISAEPLAALKAAGFAVKGNPHGRKLTPDESRTFLADADALIAGTEWLDDGVLEAAPKLRVISRVGTGLDNVDLDAARRRGIAVHNTPDAHVPAVAELTLAGLLDVLRRLSWADRQVRDGRWDKPMGRLLAGKTVGIVGMGRVGRALRELLRPFGASVLAYDLRPDPSLTDVSWLDLDSLLARSDVVSLHVSSNDGGPLLGGDRIARMKEGAVLVNVARGGVVDEAALADALRAGRLGGAYLDVFENEPYEGPLVEFDSVVLTPHIGSYAAESRVRMEAQATATVIRHFAREDGA
ncbi:MAG: phosphoglycerate dehydrogenase [Acidobacteriota bacterium]